jgi:hypothetical protein
MSEHEAMVYILIYDGGWIFRLAAQDIPPWMLGEVVT